MRPSVSNAAKKRIVVQARFDQVKASSLTRNYLVFINYLCSVLKGRSYTFSRKLGITIKDLFDGIPPAIMPKIFLTMMRVPPITGFPLQTAGSLQLSSWTTPTLCFYLTCYPWGGGNITVKIMPNYDIYENIATVGEIPSSGVISRVIHDDASAKVIRIVIASGSLLKEHKAPYPGFIRVLAGTAIFKTEDKEHTVNTGTLIRMDKDLLHSVHAETTTILLIILQKPAIQSPAA